MFALGLLSFSLVVACKKEKDDDNSTKGGSNNTTPSVMTRNGEDMNLGSLIIDYFGEYYTPGVYSYDIILLSDDFIIQPDSSVTGTGNAIYFELMSPSSTTIEIGTYTFAYEDYTQYKIGYGDFVGNIDFENDTTSNAEWLSFTGGELVMKSSGSAYDFTFTATLEDGSTVTGSYKGAVTEFYDDTDTASTALQQNRFHQQARANLKQKK